MPRYVFRCMTVFITCAVFVFMSSGAFAADAKKSAGSDKSATEKKSAGSGKKSSSSPKKAPKKKVQVDDNDESKVQESFVAFQQEWMQRLARNGQYGQDYAVVEDDPDQKGAYISRYVELSEPKEAKVKKTGKKGCAFIGTICYEKVYYKCKSKSLEDVHNSPCQQESSERITEVFRYDKGKWIY